MTIHTTCGLRPCHCGVGGNGVGPAVRQLSADAETLAMVLPVFGQAVATTVGAHALISESGSYAAAELAGQPSRPGSGRRIGLRVAAGRGERLLYSPADPAYHRPAGLHLVDPHGRLAHRTELAAPEDIVILASMLPDLDPIPPQPFVAAPGPNMMPSLPIIRQARAQWWVSPPCRHQDDFLLDGGAQRRLCLPHLGASAARRVKPTILAALLEHLCHREVSFLRAVARPGCVQAHTGVVNAVDSEGPMTLLRSHVGLMAVDLDAVAQCWATRWGVGVNGLVMLELYDRAGLGIGYFGADTGNGLAVRQEWDRLIAGLP
ncbi:MAG TPA: hypothetical protein VGC40_02800 [Paenirhodobacter sp.]